MPLISSRRNPIVRRLKALCTIKGRNEASQIVLEGTHLLQEVIKIGRLPLEVIATDKWLENNHKILENLSNEVNLIKVSEEVLEISLTTLNPDGVASLIPLNDLPQSRNQPKYVLALDRLQDPGNIGTIFRNALAGEIEMIWLALGADPLSQKSLRASSGAILQLPFQRFGYSEDHAVKELAKKLKSSAQNGLQIIGAYSPKASAPFEVIPYWYLDWEKPSVLVLGNEGNGLHPLIQACCTCGVTLPHSKAVESLNVASASVPLLLERQRAKMTSYID